MPSARRADAAQALRKSESRSAIGRRIGPANPAESLKGSAEIRTKKYVSAMGAMATQYGQLVEVRKRAAVYLRVSTEEQASPGLLV